MERLGPGLKPGFANDPMQLRPKVCIHVAISRDNVLGSLSRLIEYLFEVLASSRGRSASPWIRPRDGAPFWGYESSFGRAPSRCRPSASQDVLRGSGGRQSGSARITAAIGRRRRERLLRGGSPSRQRDIELLRLIATHGEALSIKWVLGNQLLADGGREKLLGNAITTVNGVDRQAHPFLALGRFK